jgi:hypothetical protein
MVVQISINCLLSEISPEMNMSLHLEGAYCARAVYETCSRKLPSICGIA